MSTATTAAPSPWVGALARRLGAEVIETHISSVLLAGDLAYKVKKPVRLPFLDYASIEARRRCCELEVEVNRRWAPGLYLGVSRVTGPAEAPSLDGSGELLDHAVRMRRFPAGAVVAERLRAARLSAPEVDRLAVWLAAIHADAPPVQGGAGGPDDESVRAHAVLRGARPWLGDAEHDALHAWLREQALALASLRASRRAAGRVREGHGDLHLGNLLLLDDGPAAFDAIEFDPALRRIDVMDDAAFVVMDFCAAGRRDWAFRFLDGWLARGGDYDALPLLRFAVVCRALVRAMACGTRGDAAQARRYVNTALGWLQPTGVRLVITHGLPGSGKTRLSERLVERLAAVRVRSDVERKRLFGFDALADTRRAGAHLYDAAATKLTYARLMALAGIALAAGYSAVIDAAFLRRAERDVARRLAQQMGVPLSIAACDAPLPVLRERLRRRRGDASEADEHVLAQLLRVREPLGADEAPMVADLRQDKAAAGLA